MGARGVCGGEGRGWVGSWRPTQFELPLLDHSAEANLKTGPRHARHAQRGGGRLAHFDLTVEQVFSGGEDFKPLAEIVRGVGIEPEKSVSAGKHWRHRRIDVRSAGLAG